MTLRHHGMAGFGCGFGNTTQDTSNRTLTEAVADEAQSQAGQEEQIAHNPSLSHNSDPTITSTSINKTRSLREIYDKSSEVDLGALFALLTY